MTLNLVPFFHQIRPLLPYIEQYFHSPDVFSQSAKPYNYIHNSPHHSPVHSTFLLFTYYPCRKLTRNSILTSDLLQLHTIGQLLLYPPTRHPPHQSYSSNNPLLIIPKLTFHNKFPWSSFINCNKFQEAPKLCLSHNKPSNLNQSRTIGCN